MGDRVLLGVGQLGHRAPLAGGDEHGVVAEPALPGAPGGAETLFEGVCEGTMAAEDAGTRGFGYDPAFVPEGERRTMAELTDAEKDAISHRGRAAHALREWLGA